MSTRPRPLLGLCPIGKFVFSHEDAIRQKEALQARLDKWEVDYVDLDEVLPDGLVRDQKHVDAVVYHFSEQDVDAVFMPHCNFGTESAVGSIGRRLGVPVLLWGPRDEAPLADGTRLRDSLCGLFASSKVLHKLKVPFTYINNCELDDPAFRQQLDTFLRAANVAAIFRRPVRIGLIGQRIDFFWTTIINESELLDRFDIEVLPIDMVPFIEQVRERVARDRNRYAAEATEWRQRAEIEGYEDDEPLMRVLAVRDQILGLVDELGLDGWAMQDFPALVDAMGTYCFFANGLAAETTASTMESDIHGTISTLMMRKALYEESTSFLAEFTVRHPDDPNGVLLWHAGAPPSYLAEGETIKLGHHWILPSPLAGMPHFRLKDGPLTVTRFDGDDGEYQLAIGQCETMPGPFTQNNYAWVRTDNWSHWERTLIEGPFIHHLAMGYGQVGDALQEACRYIPGLQAVRLDQA